MRLLEFSLIKNITEQICPVIPLIVSCKIFNYILFSASKPLP